MSPNAPRVRIGVILGAGASADASNPGGPPADARWRPPLAKDLFRFDAHPNYWEVASGYRGVRVLSPELAEVLAAGSASLEEKLTEFATHSDQRIREHFRQVPPYLRDLILSVTAQYSRNTSPGRAIFPLSAEPGVRERKTFRARR